MFKGWDHFFHDGISNILVFLTILLLRLFTTISPPSSSYGQFHSPNKLSSDLKRTFFFLNFFGKSSFFTGSSSYISFWCCSFWSLTSWRCSSSSMLALEVTELNEKILSHGQNGSFSGSYFFSVSFSTGYESSLSNLLMLSL